MMIKQGTLIPGILAASAIAGPVFLAASAAGSLYAMLPKPIVISRGVVVLMYTALLPAVVLGFIIGLVINGLGAMVMTEIGKRLAWARPSFSWAVAGALIGATSILFDPAHVIQPVTFALIVTSAPCAWLCCYWVEWVEDA